MVGKTTTGDEGGGGGCDNLDPLRGEDDCRQKGEAATGGHHSNIIILRDCDAVLDASNHSLLYTIMI
jgi:hypothetical protein